MTKYDIKGMTKRELRHCGGLSPNRFLDECNLALMRINGEINSEKYEKLYKNLKGMYNRGVLKN